MSTRIAMWSGPRNISTAMMRSWGSRTDTYVCDEPLYGHYLLKTGIQHPGADEVIAHHETDWRKAVAWLTGPIPEGKSIFYQKHMTHHLLPEIERGWLEDVTNAFLIRSPREVVASFTRIAGTPRLEDTGLPQQLDIFNYIRERTGRIPPVVDARDVLRDPRTLLKTLCAALDVEFSEQMLSWAPGPRTTDGVWAKHWYGAVLRSTTFQPYEPRDIVIPASLQDLLDQAEAIYNQLAEHRLRE